MATGPRQPERVGRAGGGGRGERVIYLPSMSLFMDHTTGDGLKPERPPEEDQRASPLSVRAAAAARKSRLRASFPLPSAAAAGRRRVKGQRRI